MISRSRRIDKHLFREVFSHGDTLSGIYVYAKMLSIDGKSRFSFSVPKSVARGAARRNALKRRGYSCLEPLLDTIPSGVTLIFFFKKNAHEATREELCIDIKESIGKIKV